MRALNHVVPYLIVTAVFTLAYLLLPNTRVELRAALIGGVTAGALWALVGEAFTEFILYSSRMLAVYTSFAIVLTALTWVYTSWLIFLIGGQLAFYVQLPQYLRHGAQPVELSGIAREQAGLAVMVLIGRGDAAGGSAWTGARLAAELDIPEGALLPVLECLEHGRLIVKAGQERVLPARDPAQIDVADIRTALRVIPSSKLKLDLQSVPGVVQLQSEIDALIGARLKLGSLADLMKGVTRPRSSSH
jgi:membrane protein